MSADRLWKLAVEECDPSLRNITLTQLLGLRLEEIGSIFVRVSRKTAAPESFLNFYFSNFKKKFSSKFDSLILQELNIDQFNDVEFLGKLFNSLLKSKQHKLILKFGDRLIELEPANWQISFHCGVSAVLLKNPFRAKGHFERVIKNQPHNPHALANLVSVNALLCDWNNREVLTEKVHQLALQILDSNTPVLLNPFEGGGITLDALAIQKIAVTRARSIQNESPEFNWKFSDLNNEKSRLRVGYLSADFRDHPVSHLLGDVLTLHDRDEFEVFCYGLNVSDRSEYYRKFQNGVEHFVDLASFSKGEQAAQIASANLDILVDLGGYSVGGRPDILAMRPCRRQIHFLGYASTLGAEFIDGYIGDSYCIDDTVKKGFSERVFNLENCFMPPGATPDMRLVSQGDKTDYGFQPEDKVICVFNASYKMDPTVFAVWMSILKKVPRAKLWFKFKPIEAIEFLKNEAIKFGVDPERLILCDEYLPEREHLMRIGSADLFLDTPLYNAHATAVTMLKSGLPILTVSGSTMASRISGSILSAIGMEELICKDLKIYENRAIELLQDDLQLKKLRETLRSKLESDLFFSPNEYIKKWEQLLINVCEEIRV